MSNMIYVLIVVFGTALIWTGYFVSKAIERKRQEEEYNLDKSKLIGDFSKQDLSEKQSASYAKQLTQDELYSIKYNLYICPQCETINDQNSVFCAACGARIIRKRENNVL